MPTQTPLQELLANVVQDLAEAAPPAARRVGIENRARVLNEICEKQPLVGFVVQVLLGQDDNAALEYLILIEPDLTRWRGSQRALDYIRLLRECIRGRDQNGRAEAAPPLPFPWNR